MQNGQSYKEEQNGENQRESHAIKDMSISEQLGIKFLHSLCFHELLGATFGPEVLNLVLETAAMVEAVEHIVADLLRGRVIDGLHVEYGLTRATFETGSEPNQPSALIRAQYFILHLVGTQFVHIKVRGYNLFLLSCFYVIHLETCEMSLLLREVVGRDDLVFEVDDGVISVHALKFVPVDGRLDDMELSLEFGIFLETLRHEEYIIVNLFLQYTSVAHPHLRCHNSLLQISSPLTPLILPHKESRMDLHA